MSAVQATDYVKISYRSQEEATNWPQRRTKILLLHSLKGAIINFFQVLEEDEKNYQKRVTEDYQEVRLRDKKVLHVRSTFLVDYANRFQEAFDAFYNSLPILEQITFIAFGRVFQEKLELFQAEGEPSLSRLVPEGHILLYQVCLCKSIAATSL